MATVRRNPALPVPQYPGWTLADLASHTASVHGRTVLVCREMAQDRVPAPRRPEDIDAADWAEKTLEEMIVTLRESDPSKRVWTVGFDQPTIGFWERRMVIETGLHRWDASSAIDEPGGLTDHVARAGLDEFEQMWLPRLGEVSILEVVATNLGASWRYGTGDPVHRVDSTASDLYLRLMARPSPVKLPAEWAAAVDSLRQPRKP